jgi:hypothetical protein
MMSLDQATTGATSVAARVGVSRGTFVGATVAVVVIALGVLALPTRAEALGGDEPFLPDGELMVAYNIKSCGTRVRFYERDYRTRTVPGGPEFDLMVIGLLDPDPPAQPGPPLAWLYFGSHMEVVDVVVTVPGTPAERLTNAQLVQRWPHACDMIEDLQLQARRRN